MRRAAARCSTRSADRNRSVERSSRSTSLVSRYGGLATTRNGLRGRLSSPKIYLDDPHLVCAEA